MLAPIPPAPPANGRTSSTAVRPEAINGSDMQDNTFSLEDQKAVLLAEIERIEAEYADFRDRHEPCDAELEMLRAENQRLREDSKMLNEGKGGMVVSFVMARTAAATVLTWFVGGKADRIPIVARSICAQSRNLHRRLLFVRCRFRFRVVSQQPRGLVGFSSSSHQETQTIYRSFDNFNIHPLPSSRHLSHWRGLLPSAPRCRSNPILRFGTILLRLPTARHRSWAR